MDRAGVDLAHRVDLASGEAVRAIAGRALQDPWVDRALVGPADDAVLEAIEIVAGLHDRVGPQRALGSGEVGRCVALRGREGRELTDVSADAVVAHGTDHDAIVVCRIPDGLSDTLRSTGRTSEEIGARRIFGVELLDHVLGQRGHQVCRSMAITDSELFAFIYDEAQILDEEKYEDWLGLFADDGRYWVPLQGRFQADDGFARDSDATFKVGAPDATPGHRSPCQRSRHRRSLWSRADS